jgi:hypothetical protein
MKHHIHNTNTPVSTSTRLPEVTPAVAAQCEAETDAEIHIEDDLLNEYQDNHRILGGNFPFEFVRGVPESLRKGGLPLKVARRLLLAYVPTFERCHELIFYMLNQKQRHAASRAVFYETKTQSHLLERLKEAVADPGFDPMLAAAQLDPSGPEARELLRIMTPLIRVTGAKIPWSPQERDSELSTMMAKCNRYGTVSNFITFAQSSANDPLVIKIGSRKLNQSTKAVWDETVYSQRMEIAMSNPATAAECFNAVSKAVIEHLFGVPLDTKKEYLERKPGLWGYARSCNAVSEAQQRGGLHLHALVYGCNGPIFLSRFLHTDAGQAHVRDIIKSVVTATLSPEEHEVRETKVETAPYPAALVDLRELRMHGRVVASRCQFHSHRSRCRAGCVGRTQCAMGMRKAVSKDTIFEQVEFPESPSAENYKCEVQPKVAIDPPIAMKPPDGQPLPDDDPRVVCLTLQRHSVDDQMLVEFNELLSGLLNCNTAPYILGSGRDAISQVYYLVKYTSKSNFALGECLGILRAAKLKADQIPSVAEDSGTRDRNAMYLLSKVLNRVTLLQEYSSQQVRR